MSKRVWNISREGDSTTSLGSLFQGCVPLRGKKFFLGFLPRVQMELPVLQFEPLVVMLMCSNS